MRFSSTELSELFDMWRKRYGFALRIQFTAGCGCTVVEIFERDHEGHQIPLQRMVL